MKRITFATALVGLFLLPVSLAAGAAPTSRLVTQDEAGRNGLKRAWYTQIPVDPGRGSVTYVRLFTGSKKHPDTLFVQTDQAMVHAIDAETGQTLWSRIVGSPQHPTVAVGANDLLVGVLNGTRLYLLDRADGQVLWNRRVEGAPVAGVVLTNKYAFVPLVNGQVLAYEIRRRQFDNGEDEAKIQEIVAAAKKKPEDEGTTSPEASVKQPEQQDAPLALDDTKAWPLTCVSFGSITCQPVYIVEDSKNQYLAWSTTRGLFVGYVDLQRHHEFSVQYELRTSSPIVTQPTYLPPIHSGEGAEGLIFSATKEGNVNAISALRGAEIWTYATGQMIVEPVIPIADRVYVTTELGQFLCLNVVTCDEHWKTRGVGQFIAAGKSRLYVTDREGRIVVLDAQSGVPISTLFGAQGSKKLRNLWTDRIYLVSPTGLVQCLHEIEQTEPLRHLVPATSQAGAGDKGFIPAVPIKPDENPFGQAEEEESPPDEGMGGAEDPFK